MNISNNEKLCNNEEDMQKSLFIMMIDIIEDDKLELLECCKNNNRIDILLNKLNIFKKDCMRLGH
jgi:hypothetical protein